VELRLDSVEDDGMPKDCFVSVRVGDTQKLSRLAQSRVYRFPQATERHYGKIEVFRRIGACNVDVDPAVEGLREVSIDCKDAGFGSLGLKIAVDAEAAAKERPVEEAAAAEAHKKDKGTKVKVAKEYLNKHGLEARLSQAMQAVLREKPENPVEFLAARLLGVEENTLSSLKDGPTKPAAETRPAPAPAAQEVAAKPEQKPVPFKDYYPAHFKEIGPEALQAVHDKFPSQRPPAATKSQKDTEQQDFDALKEHARHVLMEASESGALLKALAETKEESAKQEPATRPPAQGEKQDDLRGMLRDVLVQAAADGSLDTALVQAAQANQRSQQTEDLEQLRQVTKDLLLAAAASGDLTTALFQVRDGESVPHATKPSVGTWLMPLPASDELPKDGIFGLKDGACAALTKAAENGELKKALSGMKSSEGASDKAGVSVLEPPASLLPSVGTWLAARKPLTKKQAQPQSAVPESAPGATPDARYLPSVGTWMTSTAPGLQAEAGNVASYKFRPSVGSWLQARPEPQDDDEEASRKPIVLPVSMLYGTSFHSTGLRPAMHGI